MYMDYTKFKQLLNFSNPEDVIRKAKIYFNEDIPIYISSRKTKKYMLRNPNNNKLVHFGEMNFEDFTKHKNLERRKAYINRSSKIKGNWKNNKYSANNLSMNILW